MASLDTSAVHGIRSPTAPSSRSGSNKGEIQVNYNNQTDMFVDKRRDVVLTIDQPEIVNNRLNEFFNFHPHFKGAAPFSPGFHQLTSSLIEEP